MITGDNNKFNKTFWYIVYITTLVFVYIFCVTFIPIPEKSQRFVDIAFGFLLGTVLGNATSYLLGGSPEDKKKEAMALPSPENTTIKETIVASKTTEHGTNPDV